MAAIPTIKMVKDDEVIIVNAPDREKYLDAGYVDFKVVPVKEEAKKPEKTPAAPEQPATPAVDPKADEKAAPAAPAAGK